MEKEWQTAELKLNEQKGLDNSEHIKIQEILCLTWCFTRVCMLWNYSKQPPWRSLEERRHLKAEIKEKAVVGTNSDWTERPIFIWAQAICVIGWLQICRCWGGNGADARKSFVLGVVIFKQDTWGDDKGLTLGEQVKGRPTRAFCPGAWLMHLRH